MIRINHRCPRSISRCVAVRGVGFLTGSDVCLRFKPADPGAGITFVRTDIKPPARIQVAPDAVTGTDRRTTLGVAPRNVELVEHVLSALAGLRIDNCVVELDACEPPGLDGSAAGFVEALLDAGIEPQPGRVEVLSVQKAIVIRHGKATLSLHPTNDECLTISYMLDYGPGSPIDRQTHTQRIDPGEFAAEIAPCRTFVLEQEAEQFKAMGVGRKTTTRDLLVFGPRGPIDNRLRFANEPARHKILDIVGDLALCGLDVRGHIVAYRSGHPLNVELSRAITARYAQPAARIATGSYFRRAA